jgi:probable H4MPT-linked C1 transfer pathway protein
MVSRVLGWDVGGANVKVASHTIGSSIAPESVERAFPLWRQPGHLAGILRELSAGFDPPAEAMAVTMTAELADCFKTKRAGVESVLEAFRDSFPRTPIHVYGVDGSFRTESEAREAPLDVAAANWMATATMVARRFPDALVIDTGSTTTDIVPVAGGRVLARGQNDPERLGAGELVYTGMQRTPICAIVDRVPFGGGTCRVAAEAFAVAADVHRWLGFLRESDYSCETPDGAGRSRGDCGIRLARMVCADRDMLDERAITDIANAVVGAQVRLIAEGIRQVLSNLGPKAPSLAVPLGSGVRLARAGAEAAGLDPVSEDARTRLPDGPASAVALILGERLGQQSMVMNE